MAILEERITRILELRMLGKGEEAIATELNLTKELIAEYEETTNAAITQQLQRYGNNIEKIANNLHISPIILQMGIKYYQIPIPESNIVGYTTQTNRKSKEVRYQEIKECVARGITDPKAIGKEIGLRENTVKNYGNSRGIFFAQQSTRRTKTVSIEKIKEAIAAGEKSVEDIAKKVGLSTYAVRSYASKEKIILPKKRRGRKTREEISKGYTYNEETLMKIRETLTTNPSSIEEICNKVELTPLTLLRYITNFNLALPKDIKPWRYDPELDALIDEGSSLSEIGDLLGKTREWARLYINASGQYQIWKAKRLEKPTKQKQKWEEYRTRKQILSVLKEQTIKRAEEESWALGKAVQYILSYKIINRNINKNIKLYTLEDVLPIFKQYEQAINTGRKVSLEELKNGLRMQPVSVGRILSRVGLEPLYIQREHKITTSEQKAMIQRAYSLPLTASDIAYFIGVRDNIVRMTYNNAGARERGKPLLFGSFKNSKVVTYRLASQVYEAQDLGFKSKEISQLLDIDKSLLEKIISNKKEYEPKIIGALRIIYADKNFKYPFRIQSHKK